MCRKPYIPAGTSTDSDVPSLILSSSSLWLVVANLGCGGVESFTSGFGGRLRRVVVVAVVLRWL
ncbi:hypothetical protein HKD37_14G040012 [Glycine soja]